MTSFVLNRRNRFQLQRQLKHSQDAALYRRTLAILEIDQGKPVGAVAEALGVTRQAVYNWIEAYAAANVAPFLCSVRAQPAGRARV